MNAELLLEHFDRISEAPDAVPRVRQLILDLAVRGKLIGQYPEGDGSVPRKLLKGREALEEGPFDIPATWRWYSVRSITENHGQKVPKADFTYIDVGAIDNKRGVVASPQILSSDDAPSRARKVVVPGDVIYSTVRPYLLNVAIIEQDYLPEPIASTAFAVLGGIGVTVPRFLWFVLRSPYFIGLVEERMRGQAYPAINDREFGQLPIPLPPLAEQHRIVAKVNELMVVCDELEARQQAREAQRDRLVMAVSRGLVDDVDDPNTMAGRIQFYLGHFPELTVRREHVNRLRQTILELGVRGRLVRHEEGAVEDFLKVVDQERGQVSKVDRRASSHGLKVLGGEFCWQVPSHWTWRPLNDISLFIDYRGRTPEKTDSGVKLITAKNVRFGRIELEPREYISRQTYEVWMTRGIPKRGDILFTTEAPLGNVALVDFDEKFALAQRVICLRPYGGFDAAYLTLYLSSPPFQKLLAATATGLTAKGIKAQKLKQLPVAIPPLNEQSAIVAKVNELMATCDELEQQIDVQTNTAKHLLESVLDQVLVG